MKRRDLMQKCFGGAALILTQSRLLPAATSTADGTSEFLELWEEARLSNYGHEFKRAYDFCLHALAVAPQNLDSGLRADIADLLRDLRIALKDANETLARQLAQVKANPDDSHEHFCLGVTLGFLGQDEEALGEYKSALRFPEQLCADCLRDSLNNIGWYHYRKGEYRQALHWFDRAVASYDNEPDRDPADAKLPLENRLLTLAALGNLDAAENEAWGYIRKFGRMPWPDRRTLAKAGVDVDAIYLNQISQTGRTSG